MSAAMGIGAGAQVVGGTMQAIAASLAQKAVEQATQAELARQQGYRNEAFNVFQGDLGKKSAETAEEQISAGASKREGEFERVGKAKFGLGKQPNMTTRDQALYKLKGMARARLGGYSDWGLDQWIQQIRTQEALNKISNFAAGTAGVFPYRLFDAQHSQDELAMWGSLISSIGGGAANYGQLFGGGGPTGGGMSGPSTFGGNANYGVNYKQDVY